jgi:hypothetical protein
MEGLGLANDPMQLDRKKRSADITGLFCFDRVTL